ncbi:MAG: restriction endonuclease subunit S [candidate division NC10 bacterium]|nr:restriction endonuclease subunit S [candidate division NC10 bacterium]MDE2321059.1 restriction endonuclease subunit S [candidate division NC10 bacterium]
MIANLKPYPAYKDSGVPWLGEVPEHWEVRRGKWLFHHRKQINGGRASSNVLSLTLRGVVNNNPDNPEGLVPKDYATYQLFRKGDLVFKLIDLENLRTSRVGLVHEDGIMSSAYVRLIPQSVGEIRFFFQQYFDLYQRGIYNQLGAGVRSTLGPSDLLDLSVVVPPLPEQAAIVRFLDYADRRIRRYIRAKQKLIKLLEEQKQAIIHRAVTRGLPSTGSGQATSNVRLKPSGVKWLGDIPEHWEVDRAKHLFREVDDRSATGTEVLLSLRMHQGLVPHNEVSTIPITPQALIGFKKVEPGQIVMNRMRAAIGMFGIANQLGLVSPDYAVFEPIANVDAAYFLRLFETPAAGTVFRVECKGLGTGSSGFMRLYTDRFGMIKLPIPPQEEQRRIVRGIAASTQEIERAEERTHREISLLREYRTRLIADVVMGKLDVREAAARLPAEAEEVDDVGARHAPCPYPRSTPAPTPRKTRPTTSTLFPRRSRHDNRHQRARTRAADLHGADRCAM